MNDEIKKTIKDNRLTELLGAVPVPVQLERSLKQNLSDQIKAEAADYKIKYWRVGLALSIAANVILAILVLVPSYTSQHPSLMDLAYGHLMDEDNLTEESSVERTAWLAKKGIKTPPDSYSVALAKNCLIGVNHVQHVRLTNARQQAINFLVFSKKEKELLPVEDVGEKGTQQWIKVSPRQGTHILAFFDNKIPNKEINSLINNMFAENKQLSVL